jgi:hypothetical protein
MYFTTCREKQARLRSACKVATVSLMLAVLTVLHSQYAATPGLPFMEDFSDTNLRDAMQTNAN